MSTTSRCHRHLNTQLMRHDANAWGVFVDEHVVWLAVRARLEHVPRAALADGEGGEARDDGLPQPLGQR